MFFKQIFDEKLAQYAYLIGCQVTKEAIIIDPMRDIDRYIKQARNEGLEIVAAAETHIHADFLSGLREFAEQGVPVYVSDEGDESWKYEWVTKSSYPYTLLHHNDSFNIGNILFKVMRTPGHTPEHLSFIVTDSAGADEPMGIITGDFVFVGDVGRPDLLETAAGEKGTMQAWARVLYQSVQRFKTLADYLQVWPGHGAGSACGKALGAVPESTVGYELRFNASIRQAENEGQFVDYIMEGQPEPPLYFSRMKRDNKQGPRLLKELPTPKKMKAEEFISQASSGGVILDTRSRSNFMKNHLPDSLLAPFNKQFNTTAGSYIREDEPIYLVIGEEHAGPAVRDLVRVGLDHITGFISPGELEDYLEKHHVAESIDCLSFKEADQLVQNDGYKILDVRRASEFEEGHIGGAINIAHTRLAARIDELPPGKTWLVHCRSGSRGSVAAAFLKKEGFRIKLIDDEIEPWLEEVAP